MRKHVIPATLSAALMLAAVVAFDGLRQTTATSQPTVSGEMDRTVLPIPEPNYPHATELDARDATAPPRFEVKPPKGAPNVIVFLIDDIGFGHAEHVRRRHSHADARAPCQPGAQVQPLPYHGPLLAHTRGPADRPQPPHQQRGRDHGSRYSVPGQHRRTAAQRHAAGRDSTPEWL